MTFTIRNLASALLLVIGCTLGAAQRGDAPRKAAATQARAAIVARDVAEADRRAATNIAR